MASVREIFRDQQARTKALESYERTTELPLLVLALAIIPLLVIPFAFDLDSAVDDAFLGVDYLIWAVFAIDLTVRTYLTESRLRYLVSHWYDVLIVVVPFLRPLRVFRSARALRLLRLTWVTAFAVRLFAVARALGKRNGLAYVMAVGVGFVFAASSLVFAFERGGEGPIDDYPTALWWAFVTITTVGYGDSFPVTNEGRGIAVLVMVAGISLFGFLTATIAAFLVEQRQDESETTLEDILAKLNLIEREVVSLRRDADGIRSDVSDEALRPEGQRESPGEVAHG